MLSNRMFRLIVLLATLPVASHAAPFNDTGRTTCLAGGTVSSLCTVGGQDAASGRDADHASPKNGVAGFAFVKLDTAGRDLPAAATKWACVRDLVTGLVWEVKSADPGNPRYYLTTYTFKTGGSRDVQNYAASTNRRGLCGYSDWRVPSRVEYDSLVTFEFIRGSGRAIDRVYFGEDIWRAWTTTRTSLLSSNYYTFDLISGLPDSLWQYDDAQARLVRGGARQITMAAQRFEAAQDEVRDRLTGLVWQRCAEGQLWTGQSCQGEPTLFSWDAALAYADLKNKAGWRIANVKELASLTAMPKQNPSIDSRFFPGTSASYFWTSTYRDPGYAWTVSFADGYQYVQTVETQYPIRLVRALQ